MVQSGGEDRCPKVSQFRRRVRAESGLFKFAAAFIGAYSREDFGASRIGGDRFLANKMTAS